VLSIYLLYIQYLHISIPYTYISILYIYLFVIQQICMRFTSISNYKVYVYIVRHNYVLGGKFSNFWMGPQLAFTILRCIIPVVCRINQTIRCMHISSDTTMY